MKVIGYYNKHNNNFYGYVSSNEYVIVKNIENIYLYSTGRSHEWIINQGRALLTGYFNLRKQGKDQREYVDEMFKYSKKEDIVIKVIDYTQVIRNYKLAKIINLQKERKINN